LEALNNQNLEPKALDNQDIELEVLAAYNSTDELSDIVLFTVDLFSHYYFCFSFDNVEEFSIGKAFKNWDQKVNFWFKNNKNHIEVITFNNKHIEHEFNLLASQFDLMLFKLSKEIVK
ncbi:8435_t:CDS:2, partial [Dentiscutata erythropus]